MSIRTFNHVRGNLLFLVSHPHNYQSRKDCYYQENNEGIEGSTGLDLGFFNNRKNDRLFNDVVIIPHSDPYSIVTDSQGSILEFKITGQNDVVVQHPFYCKRVSILIVGRCLESDSGPHGEH